MPTNTKETSRKLKGVSRYIKKADKEDRTLENGGLRPVDDPVIR